MRATPPHPTSPPQTGERSKRRSLLFTVTLLSLLPRIWFAVRVPLSHNGAWHLFAARFFAREYAAIAHPPLFLLLLKACDAFSRSLLSYRLVPIAAGVASVYLVGRILQKVGCSPTASALGALTIALSTTAIALSIQVEGHMLCVFFVLAAFFFYLDLLSPHPERRSRIGFAVFASLALLTEYVAGIFLIACVLAPLAAALLSPRHRQTLRREFAARLPADALTLAAPMLAGAVLYALVARRWAATLSGPATGLPLFYFRPAAETAANFVVRNLSHTATLFSPVALARHLSVVLGLFVLLAVAAPAWEARRRDVPASRLFPALFLAILLAVGAALGLAGLYPFGGTPRHQVLMLFFAVLAGFVAIDPLLRKESASRVTLSAICAAAIAANAVAHRDDVRRFGRDEPLNARAGIFEANLGRARVVHLDLMSFIGLFMDFYESDSRFAGRISDSPRIERYELQQDGRRLTVIAHRGIWIMKVRDPALYREIRSVPGGGDDCATLFAVDRNLYFAPRTLRPFADRAAIEKELPAAASAAGFETRSLTVSDDFVEAELCPRPK